MLLRPRLGDRIMLIRTYTCDSCGKDISDGSDAMHRLVLSEDQVTILSFCSTL
jgi:hypothetical protein